MLRGAIIGLSSASFYCLTGTRKSWCAYAHDNRTRLIWRAHIAVWDRVFLKIDGETDHCANSSAWWQENGAAYGRDRHCIERAGEDRGVV